MKLYLHAICRWSNHSSRTCCIDITVMPLLTTSTEYDFNTTVLTSNEEEGVVTLAFEVPSRGELA